ncbi:MAG: large-conductance mechanosensitive channel protein MscL [Flavobacteriales bacterium]|nr:large-conductance mechanosensitive channel protein MscL [Flavobacteriales bacterium]MBK6943136.1 large-conductance mechanosensitive channel protein MscL [Flavobacteriales bacterium]MBK7242168.1 large-conductance mechanosensitive channel protein MscL [Flavobacteriales bacterium]MBK7298877.1 large-conductance mechanosensitive channel protein MscL [Flavobacteriales bacterium]MBK9534560.1 large-conductance mechanosensitive channel protein MscL [Flavobacteriales bacterium]
MSMMKEFKEFAMKGNLVDIAVGFVMGAAFGKVVSGFIDGIVMPAIGMITSGIDFNQLKYVLKAGAPSVTDATGAIVTAEVAEVAMTYGAFVTTVINFIVVAFVVFMLVKAMNKAKKSEPAPPPAGPTADQKLLMEIRDALKK